MPNTQEWARLQGQLVRHGYLSRDHVDAAIEVDALDPDLARAIAEALRSQNQSVVHDWVFDGKDAAVLDKISSGLEERFCGVPDRGGSLGPLTFGSPGGRWSQGALRVSIDPSGFQGAPGVAIDAVAVLISAFAQWQAVSRFFNFSYVAPNTGEHIRVMFGSQKVDSRFGSPGGVLATGAYPESGNLQFDASEAWTANALLGTALHEIGHVLGLSHSNAPGGLMYPYATPRVTVDVESQDALASMYDWQPQQRLADRGTGDRVALGTTSTADFNTRWDTVHMVWRGIDESRIYWSELSGAEWTPQGPLAGYGSSHTPALSEVADPSAATPSTGLFMAWKGVQGDHGLYWTRRLGGGWESQRSVPNVGSSEGPALANLNGRVYMAWKGIPGDSNIYWASHDGAGGWTPQSKPIAGIGTSAAPALVAYKNMLYMFWKGVSGDSRVYYSYLDVANDPIWKPQQPVEYFSYQAEGGVRHAIGTSGAPSATVRGDQILLAWKGVSGDATVWGSLLRNGEFSGQFSIPNVGSSTGPSVVNANGSTFMAWKGIDGDTAIYWTRL